MVARRFDVFDPVVVVLAPQTMVARRFDVFDPVVVASGHATVASTLRACPSQGRYRLLKLLSEVAVGVACAHGVTAEYI